MVRGIGSFVEGSSTLAGWWSNVDTTSFQARTEGEGLLDPTQQDLAKQALVNPLTGREATSTDDLIKGSRSRSDKSKCSNSFTQLLRQHQENLSKDPSAPKPLPHLTPQETHRRAVRTAFAKASNILRESLEVEGILFLDACVSTFGGMVPHPHHEGSTSPTATSPSGESDTSKSPLGEEIPTTRLSDQQKAADETMCEVLAYATSDNSTINQSLVGGNYPLTESSLKSFIRRYPTGSIFNFDELGALESSDSEVTIATVTSVSGDHNETQTGRPAPPPKKKKGNRNSKINDASTILKLIPEARSAVFFPLW
jgi:hypothetical protein